MTEKKISKDCPMAKDKDCGSGLGCWHDTHPTPDICAKCECLNCKRGKCPPAIIYGGERFYLNDEHY